MKIVFITPASDLRRNFLVRLGYIFYDRPNAITGPLILGKILKDSGHDVEVHEELYSNLNLKQLDNADVIGLSTMTATVSRAYELADYFRLKGKRVIIGGFHASAMPDEALQHCDQVVTGEAESVIKDVIEGKIKDQIVHSQYINDLDSIPFPDYSILKTPYYSANITSNRGCLNNCSFCTTTKMFFPYRERSVENIIDEITMYKKMGIKNINFQDNNFTANKEKVKLLLKEMIKKDLVFKDVFFFSRTDIAEDDELLELLRKIGRPVVLIGIESTNQDSLDLINKEQNVNNLEDNLKKLAKNKIKLSASVVLGFDFDKKEDLKKTVNFCKRINSFALQPPPLTIFPGTELFKQYEKEGRIITKDWQYYDMMHVMFKPKNMSSLDLQKEFFKALRRFYSILSSFRILIHFGIATFLKRLLFTLLAKSWVYFSRISERKFYSMLKIHSKSETQHS